MRIKKAGPGDLQKISDMAEVVFRHTYREILSPEQLDYMMDMMYSSDVIIRELASDVSWFIVKCNNEIAGYASIYPTELNGTPVVKLDKLYLRECFRKLGVGKQLLMYIVQEAQNAGVTKLILNVNKYNTSAQAAYKRWGFTLAKSEVNDIGNGFFMTDYVMETEL